MEANIGLFGVKEVDYEYRGVIYLYGPWYLISWNLACYEIPKYCAAGGQKALTQIFCSGLHHKLHDLPRTNFIILWMIEDM